MKIWLLFLVPAGWLMFSLLVAIAIGKCVRIADEGGDGDMARKAKHDQKSIPDSFVCTNCKEDKCASCVDVARLLYGATVTLCSCKRKGHAGEARDKQIMDPETGTVWTPGLRVTQEGEVLRGGLDDN